LLGVSAFAACNFEDSFKLTRRVDPERPGPAFADVCRLSALASCAYQTRCDAFAFGLNWPDEATCVDRETIRCQVDVTDPNARYGDAEIRACVLPAAFPCESDDWYDKALAAYRTTCPTPKGALAKGSACSTDGACADGYCFTLTSAEPLCGVCDEVPCGGGCPDGTTCFLSFDGTSECETVGAVGAPCTSDDVCDSFFCRNGACAARARLGEACDVNARTAEATPDGAPCDGNYDECDPVSMRCVRPNVAHVGEPCGSTSTGYTPCDGAATCPRYSSNPTCVPFVPDGFLCDPPEGLECLWPAACIGGYCRFRPLSCSTAD
jgi:hypothetical protein